MSTEQLQIHLIVERVGSGTPLRGTAAVVAGEPEGTPALAVPPGPAWLWPCAGEPPKVAEAKPPGVKGAVLMEQVPLRRQPRLLVVRAGAGRAHVNGLPAPRFALLKEKDTLRLDEDCVLHVAVFNQPSIGLASAERVGKECPVCRVPFLATSKCYVCACGTVMHCEDGGNDDSLQCAQLRARSGCPACQRPVVLESGYSYLPEGINE